MFKKISKLMLLAVGVLTVAAACSDEESGGSTPPATFISSVGGKEFQLVSVATGTKNLVAQDNGSILNTDKSVLYTFNSETSLTTAVYLNGEGNFFGVEYVAVDKPLNFYFDNSTTATGDYWTTADEVKFVSGDGVLLASKNINGMLSRGSLNDNVTAITDEVPTGGAISALFNAGMGELSVIADNKTPGGIGTLYTGGMGQAGITITGTQLPTGILKDMTTESLQLIGSTLYIVTKGTGTEANTDKLTIYTSKGVETSTIDNVTAGSYAISAGSDATGFYIATSDKDSTVAATKKATARVRKVSVGDDDKVVLGTPVVLDNMTGTAIIKDISTNGTDFYVASLMTSGAANGNIVLHKNAKKLNSYISPDTTLDLVAIGTDMYVLYKSPNGTNLLRKIRYPKFDNVEGAELPADILSVKGAGSVLYVTAKTSAASTTTTAYTINDLTLIKSETANSSDTLTANVVVEVAPATVALSEGNVLVIDAEKIGGTDPVIRYNNFTTSDKLFLMPTK